MDGDISSRAPYDLTKVRADFPALAMEIYGKPLVYLDNGASAQKPRAVVDRMVHVFEHEYANVHRGLHYLANAATYAAEVVFRPRRPTAHTCVLGPRSTCSRRSR